MGSVRRLGAVARKKLGSAIRLFRQDPVLFFRGTRVQLDHYVVFSAATNRIPPPAPLEGATFRKLTDDELQAFQNLAKEIRDPVETFRPAGYNGAYAVFCEGKLAHVAWLVPAEEDEKRSARLVKLRPGEAEIAYCVTLPQFRGLGIYPFAIQNLFQVCRELRIQEVFMRTRVRNEASQRGILKAGLSRRRGRIIRLKFLYTNLVYRSFRS